MKHLRIYARLSNTKTRKDVSIERQLADGHAYAKTRRDLAHDCERDDLVEPRGIRSGTSDIHRPVFRAFMNGLSEDNSTGALWVYDQSRFSRGDNVVELIKKLENHRVELIIGQKTIDLGSLDDELGVRTGGFVYAIESLLARQRQRKRIAAEKQAGAWLGRPPLGLRIEGKGIGRHLVKDDRTYSINGKAHSYLDTVIAWFQFYTTTPCGAPSGATYLNQCGYRWKSRENKPVPVSHQHLDRIGTSPYRGILDDQLLDAVEAKRKRRAMRNENGRQPRDTVPLLWHLVYCASCKESYRLGYFVRFGPERHITAYYHYHAAMCQHRKSVDAATIDNQVLEILEPLAHLSNEDKDKIAKRMFESQEKEDRDERKELEEKISRLEDLAIDGNITKEKYLAKREELLKRLGELEPARPRKVLTLDECRNSVQDLVTTIRKIREIDSYLANQIACAIIERVELLDGKLVSIHWEKQFANYYGIGASID